MPLKLNQYYNEIAYDYYTYDYSEKDKQNNISSNTTPPTIIWLGGYRSDKDGTKAQTIFEQSQQNGWPCLKFDYRGHGLSKGNFEELCLSDWVHDAETIINQIAKPPYIFIGSSMGGWISLILAKKLAAKYAQSSTSNASTPPNQNPLLAKNPLKGLILIAPAPDFTKYLMWDEFDDNFKNEIITKGIAYRPSPYDTKGDPITKKLIEDGEKNLILNEPFRTYCDITILHGTDDEAVPISHAMKLFSVLSEEMITLTSIPNGDHRLSRDEDLQLLKNTLEFMVNNG